MAHHVQIWNIIKELSADLDRRIVIDKDYLISDYRNLLERVLNYHLGNKVEWFVRTKKDKDYEADETAVTGQFAYEDGIIEILVLHNRKKYIKTTLLLKQQLLVGVAHELAHYYQEKYHPLFVPAKITKKAYTSQHHEIDAFALNIALSFVFTKRGINRIRYRNAVDVCDDLWWFYENADPLSIRKLLKKTYSYYHKFKELQKYDRRKKVRTNQSIRSKG